MANESVIITGTRFNQEPGVISSYEHGWQQLWKYFLELFLITIISWLISIPTGIPNLWMFGSIYGVLIEGPVAFGVSYANLRAVRGDKLVIEHLFAAFRNYLNAVLASLLTSIIIVFGLAFLIVPGIIFACKLAFTPYPVVDRKMEAIEAMKTSWNMTDGHPLQVFGIGLLAIPICFAGILLLIVGIIPAIMWINLAFASLYRSVSIKSDTPGVKIGNRNLEIAKERYVKGEISKEEFEQLKKDLT